MINKKKFPKSFKNLILIFVLMFVCLSSFSQNEEDKDYTVLSKEQILELTYEELLTIPFEQLLIISEKFGVSIDELLEMKISVSSKKAINYRETPGIVSVITRDEIRKSGARNLTDILEFVPGTYFGVDVDAVIGLGSRGNWGHEGKILLIIDGQEQNELFYGTLQFDNHYFVENIEKIEIIRGPGSSIYGGYAELGVINIVTRQASEINGIEVGSNIAVTEKQTARAGGYLNFGKKFKNTELTFSSLYAKGNRFDSEYEDFYGNPYDYKDGYSEYQTMNFNLGVKHKNLSFRTIYDEYSPISVDYPEKEINNFMGFYSEITYKLKAGEKFCINPKLNMKYQEPWTVFSDETEWWHHQSVERYTANVSAIYEHSEKLNVIGGGEYYFDYARNLLSSPDAVFSNEKKEIDYSNISAYIQALIKFKYINFIAGGRADYHNQSGKAFSPRLGLTGVYKNLHYKLLYSKAFRAPSIENIEYNSEIKPEKTTVIELETGLRLNENVFVTANIFDISIEEPIVYIYSYTTEEENYLNYESSGTRGFEVEFRFLSETLSCNLSYSYYSQANKNKVELYEVYKEDGEVDENLLLAAPQHKISLLSNYRLFKHLNISPSLIYFGKKYAYTEATYDEESEELTASQSELPASLLANLCLSYENLFTKGLTAYLSIHNILDTKLSFPQAYNGEIAPYPRSSRMLNLKLSYNLRF